MSTAAATRDGSGDYVGHRSPSSTMIYAKVQVDALRELALDDGEDLQ